MFIGSLRTADVGLRSTMPIKHLTGWAFGLILALGYLASPMTAQAARGVDESKTVRLWKKLETDQGRHLRQWRRGHHGGEPTAVDVLEAFSDIVYQVSAPGGFWRKDVPGWLGCRAMPSSACDALDRNEKKLAKFDAMVETIAALPERRAERFLNRHYAEMVRYLDYYVPSTLNMSAMEQTGLYRDTLSDAFESSAGLDELL